MTQASYNLEYPRRIQPLVIGKRWFYSVAQYPMPYDHLWDIEPDRELIRSLGLKGVDLFTFIQRSFLSGTLNKRYSFFRDFEPIGLLRITSFDDWWKSIGNKARGHARKGAKLGLKIDIVAIDERFMEGALRIYNETPIRQGRRYSGYGLSLSDLRNKFSHMDNSEVLGAYFRNELIGLLWISYGDKVAALESTFLSLIKCRDKYPNDALLAESVKRCCEKGYHFLTYGNMGYLPGLDFFKRVHGFRIFSVPRFYVPLSSRGQLAINLGVFKPVEHSLPKKLIPALLPLYGIISKSIPLRSRASTPTAKLV